MNILFRPAFAGLLCLLAPHARADDALRLDEVVISAPSADDTLRTVPHGVSVITAGDIERAGAQGLGDLLGREAGLNLQSYFGRDKGATVDMRGLGATAVSNVLVLVDGVRLNADDLSGADLSSVALSQVERIEVLRGAGAVRYGDGAVGGIIHVLTKRPRSGPLRGEFGVRSASYDTRELRFSASGGAGPLFGRIDVGRLDGDGYRDNDEQRRRDTAAELRIAPDGALSFMDVLLRVSRHTYEYKLPGQVSRERFLSGRAALRRSSTASPLDGGSTDDRKFGTLWRFDLGEFGLIEFQADHRTRDNPYLIGVNPAQPLSDQQYTIESTRRDVQLRYDLDYSAFGRAHHFGAGFVTQSSDYLRRDIGRTVIDQSRLRTGDLNGQAWYAETVFRATDALRLNAGWRSDDTKSRTEAATYRRTCQFQTVFIPGSGVISVEIPGSCVAGLEADSRYASSTKSHAAELGLSWQPEKALVAFASVSRNFRNPNIDELALASSDLRAQHGRTIEAGVRLQPDDRLSFGLTLFRLRNQDEIYFDSTGVPSVNRNYELPTVRTGVEVDLRWRIRPGVLFAANAGYVQPRFEGSDADVPLVPRRTANLRIEWTPAETQRLTLSARHAGRRFDGNDTDNRSFAALPSYTVFDLALSVRSGAATWSAGVNNLFDKVYSTLAYSSTYYPMPERTAWLGVSWQLE
ncbi:MAG: TonB-dependent receptor [Methyloversatilis sp.]|nr:TonB-dependent receptor [Methyloversatilis sp.]